MDALHAWTSGLVACSGLLVGKVRTLGPGIERLGAKVIARPCVERLQRFSKGQVVQYPAKEALPLAEMVTVRAAGHVTRAGVPAVASSTMKSPMLSLSGTALVSARVSRPGLGGDSYP